MPGVERRAAILYGGLGMSPRATGDSLRDRERRIPHEEQITPRVDWQGRPSQAAGNRATGCCTNEREEMIPLQLGWAT